MATFDGATYRARVGRAFSPSAPITTRDVFSGRKAQLDALLDVVSQKGQHGIVYGDRGVGKTSLARVVNDVFSDDSEDFPWHAAYYTCSSSDTFASIWRGLFNEVILTRTNSGLGFSPQPTLDSFPASDLLRTDTPSPDDVRRLLSQLSASTMLVLFVDEFDRPEDDSTQRMMADLIKILADQAIPVTIVLIGVGETVNDLMSGHESVHRSLVQIQMPTMDHVELADIVNRGMASAGLTVDSRFVRRVADLSLGLPHYTHLLAQQGALAAVMDGRTNVTVGDFDAAVARALEGASQTTRERYHHAVSSNRETLYAEVLLACARAKRDGVGTFGAPDVRDQLRSITGRELEIPAFAHHLNDFSSSNPPRGGVLVKRGTTRRFRYKFADPLMPPFVLMMGTLAAHTKG